ncbi:hypothetical protein AB0B31_10865 [Catellatospora citrea]|uniref:hypothetical protein n=1 Tax=Catellatospora citrea TaxID=53366 RepID=UPI0033D1B00C
MPSNEDPVLDGRHIDTTYQPAHYGNGWAARDIDSRRDDLMGGPCWQLTATWWPDDEHLLLAQLADPATTCFDDVARRWGLTAWNAEGTAFGPATGISATLTCDTVALAASRLLWAHTDRPALWQPGKRCQLLVMQALPDPDTDPVLALLERAYRGPAYLGDLAVTEPI